MLRKIRFAVALACCLVGAPFLIVRSFGEAPAFDELLVRTGPVTLEIESHRSRRSRTETPVLTLRGAAGRYEFPAHLGTDRIHRLVEGGEIVTLRVDSEEFRIWQLERDGEVLLSYDEIRTEFAKSRRLDLIFGAALAAVGVVVLVVLIRRGRRSR